MIRNLTEGKTDQILWRFTLPMFVSVIFQQLYNIADSVVAGKFAGEDALAAVGASYPITMIFMAVAVGSNIGCSVVISQLFGARRLNEMKTAIYTTLVACLGLSILLTTAGLLGCHQMMKMIQTPDNIFDSGSLYLNIYIGGFLFLYLYNVCTGIFTALGDSKTPLYFLIGSSIGNIILDLIFVIQFHWGVAGVAWATFAAQGIACILAVFTLHTRIRQIKTEGKVTLFSTEMLGKISSIAIPSILQQSFISIGNMFVQGLINSFGSSVIAGYSAAVKLNTFTITSFTTLGNGVSSFTAQNIGAGKEERVKEGHLSGLKLAFGIALPFVIAFFFFGKSLIQIFMEDANGPAMDTGVRFLKIVAPFYFAVSLKLITDGVLRGAGAMKAFMAATFSDLILRVAISFLLVSRLGTDGIWFSWPIGWVIGTGVSLWYYKSGVWKLSKMIKDQNEDER